MEEQLMRKGRLVRQLLEFLKEWKEVNSTAVPMRIVACRFAKAMNRAGGFQEIIDELRRDGTIAVALTERGGRVVQLTNGTDVTVPFGLGG